MAIILLVCGPCVVIVKCWYRFCTLVEVPVERRLCPIFVSGVGLPTSMSILRVDGLSTRHPEIGASQLGVRAKVNDYLGSSVGVELRYTKT